MKLIGYTPVTTDGTPHRTGRRAGWDRKAGLNPPRIYTKQARAESYSPDKKAAPVYMGEIE